MWWIKTLYKNINSCILYSGHHSNSFSVSRGVRQGDPLSPYLSIICAELLADAIKQNGQINGISFLIMKNSYSEVHVCR